MEIIFCKLDKRIIFTRSKFTGQYSGHECCFSPPPLLEIMFSSFWQIISKILKNDQIWGKYKIRQLPLFQVRKHGKPTFYKVFHPGAVFFPICPKVISSPREVDLTRILPGALIFGAKIFSNGRAESCKSHRIQFQSL